MKSKTTAFLAALLAATAAPCAPLATENFVTNKIAAAISQIPQPDFSTNNAALVETIEATAPAPGDYDAVSNAAVYAAITNALQDTAIAEKQDKLPYPTNSIPYAAISGKPTNVSAFNNDAGYLTSYTESDPVWTREKSGYARTNEVQLSERGFTGWNVVADTYDDESYVGDVEWWDLGAWRNYWLDVVGMPEEYLPDPVGTAGWVVLVWPPFGGTPEALEMSTDFLATNISASGNYATVTATRTALSGYQLGNDTMHILASEAEAEALRTAVAGKADKSEMSITAVSGDATKKNIQLKSGTAQDVVIEHQQLTDTYGGNGEKYSAWTITAGPEGVAPNYIEVVWWNNQWCFMYTGLVDPDKTGVTDADATSLTYSTGTWGCFATRTANPIISYQLGAQSDRKLATAEQGEKASTALQGVKVGSSPVTPESDRVVSLGTAAAKDVPASGDASSTQVVMGNDSRLPKAEDSVQRLPDNATPSAKTAVTVGTRSTENAADRGQASLTVGDHPKASGPNAVATGTWTEATALNARADGNMCKATNNGAHSEGNNTQATGPYSHAEGTDTAASGLVAHAEGNYTTAGGTGAHAEGMFSKASGVAAHAEGCNLDRLADVLQAAGASAEIVVLFRQAATDAAGSFSHTEGLVTATSEMGSHAQGFRASDGGNPFSFVWQGYSGAVPTAAQMQALLDNPKSDDAQAALQCLVTALTARAAYTSKGRGTFCVNPAPQGGSTDPKSGFFVGDESLDKALRFSFHAATVTPGSSGWTANYSQIYNAYGELVAVEMPFWSTESTPDGDKTGWFWSNPDMVYILLSEDESATSLTAYWDGFNGEESIAYTINFSKATSPATVTNVLDRAINTATLGSSVTAATITLPAATAGYARDFYFDLTIEATDAPTLTFIDPATGASANIAFSADALADIAPGSNLVRFTELPNNRWLVSVRHEEAS